MSSKSQRRPGAGRTQGSSGDRGRLRTTRGPLPPGVYWRRRAFVLGVAFSLVFVIARWLTAGSDGSDDGRSVAVEQAGARVSATGTVTAGQTEAAAGEGSPGATGADASASPTAPVTPTLAAPQGECDPADIVVTPAVAKGAEAGHDVALTLSLQTQRSEACTWKVTSKTVVVRVARPGGKALWTTLQCGRVVPRQSVVLRNAVATEVALTWNARKSDARCSKRTDWLLPGDYTIAAAALGGEPTETEFALAKPAPRTVTVTEKPRNTEKTKKPKKPVN
ncbi:hypothetical protein JK386_14260 [Nocardioides sp. zg-536]|uniref:DUF4232 domain-containing protein n=1 Tax=Nocardioides faecalis TaxID=2803858 RepID=A0A938YBR0_9ACTN|nr:hypothetical protein [Nocardioides faecalis]MBM9461061.1 hypothetical protein [Nocardioides faecalis]QVI59146.1 hypothetical protein KG111_01800 [Nocardioides faecalis]